MPRTTRFLLLAALVGLGAAPAVPAAGTGDFRPDPKSVQRYGPAYRYPQAGWIVLHVEGEPYERGYQHGRLLAPEIAAHLRCAAAVHNPKAPSQGWRQLRTLVNALFVRRYDKEYLEEMKGIADGATAAGARFDNRPVDLVDVVGLNAWPEIDTLDAALNATATGLEGIHFPHAQPKVRTGPKPMRCSAFAATGQATADGKVVIGHITMFGLYPSLFYNVWLDVKPARGYRVLMQTYPAGIQSGLDYYLNSAGLVVCETTIAQTRFDINGMTVASRIRQALQYADSIDKAVEILKKANNGLYTNEWLLADTKTNEIAMFELGTHQSKLYRSSRGEWFGGTEGFYWGCNNAKDLKVRLETVASVEGRPANVVFRPSDRDKTWLRLYHQYKGKIDARFGKVAFTTPPLAAFHSVDAKFTTSDMARDLKTWALFGPPLGRSWEPTNEERQLYPEVRALVSNPWAVLTAEPPAKVDLKGLEIADLPDRVRLLPREREVWVRRRFRGEMPPAAWHGTILPKTDADVWLSAAFADYEKIYAREKEQKELREQEARQDPQRRTFNPRDRDEIAVALYGYRSSYLAATRSAADAPLSETHSELARDEWYRVAAGKGVLVLNELRRDLGDEAFEKVMDSFGRDHAGKQVTGEEFKAHVEKASGKKLDGFFAYWLNRRGLPALRLGPNVRVEPSRKTPGYLVRGEIRRDAKAAPMVVDVTVETPAGEVTKKVSLDGPVTRFQVHSKEAPKRVVVDKYGRSARANGGVYSTNSYYAELDETLIVYGTADEVPTNREAAKALQKGIRQRGANITVPIKADKEVTEEDLRSHHLLLIGRPDSNPLVERVRAALPVTFGSRSFVAANKSYAHAGSAVVAAGESPFNKRYSVVVLAGLGAEATLRAVPQWLFRGQPGAEVLVLANGAEPRSLVVPARDLVRQVKEANHAEARTRPAKAASPGGGTK